MKRFIFSIVFVAFGLSLYGQKIDPEALMTKRIITCPDILYNASYLIPGYYEKGSIDTLNSVLDFWEQNCGITEPITRCRILIALS